VHLVAAWILAGALFKLLRGTPADLPQLVREIPLRLGLTYKLVISIELAISLVALLRPRWGWPLLVLQLCVFDAVLARQLAAGETSCGCFGKGFPIPTWGMAAIDSSLLVLLLAARPWSGGLAAGLPAGALVLVGALALPLPWAFDREAPAAPPASSGADGGAGEPTLHALRQYVELDVEKWVGKDLSETPLARWLDVYQYPPNALWVLWRQTCDHCARHLAKLAQEETGERFLVLVQIQEEGDTEANRVVHLMPQGDFVLEAELPDSVDYVVTTPAEIETVDWKVVKAAEGVDDPEDE